MRDESLDEPQVVGVAFMSLMNECTDHAQGSVATARLGRGGIARAKAEGKGIGRVAQELPGHSRGR